MTIDEPSEVDQEVGRELGGEVDSGETADLDGRLDGPGAQPELLEEGLKPDPLVEPLHDEELTDLATRDVPEDT